MTFPFVSIIIPVFNNQDYLKACLECLLKQTYPQHAYEIIVVDNNSSEDISAALKKDKRVDDKRVRLAFESTPGSYAARNQGISVARGDVLAFIDSDCRPVDSWIANGVNALQKEGIDLVGGQVKFSFSSQKTPAEIYDSAIHMRAKRNIEERRLTATANLFTYRYVFDAIGLFPQTIQSGGDLIWTKNATDANFNLVYAPDAMVFHPARGFKELLKKQFRVGKGQPLVWLAGGHSLRKTAFETVYCLIPLKPKRLLAIIEPNRRDDVIENMLRVLWVAWSCNMALALGRLTCIFEQIFMRYYEKKSPSLSSPSNSQGQLSR